MAPLRPQANVHPPRADDSTQREYGLTCFILFTISEKTSCRSPSTIWPLVPIGYWTRRTERTVQASLRSGVPALEVNLLQPLRNALSEALADEVIDFNPLNRLKLSRILPRDTLRTDYEPDPYTVEELVPLLVSMQGAERAAFQFWVHTGIRTSELVALSWSAVDLVAGTAHIHMAVVEGEEKGTKTRAGVRTIPLLLAARQALEDQRQRTEKAGGRVFLNPRTGKEWTDQSLLRLWQRTCKKGKARYRNPHQMRHTFASQLLSQGENPAYIAKLLGHKTTEMVIRHYGRWVEQGVDLGFDRPPVKYGRECLPGLPEVTDTCESGAKRV